MIKIYSNQNGTIVHHLRNVLQNIGIQCEVRNEILGRSISVATEWWVELWIMDVERYDEAMKVIEEVLSDANKPGRNWRCSKCGEESEGQFTECWNCGESRL